MGKKRGGKEAKKGGFPNKRLDHEHFYPFLLGDQPLETLDEKEMENMRAEIEESFFDFLKSINEETLQLSEFLIEDKKLARELCRLLKPILKHLNLSFVIAPGAIPLSEKTEQIILNEEGHLIFVHGKGKINSKALEEYPPEIILIVFLNVIPKFGKLLRLYRKRVDMRISFFEKIYRELENVGRVFATSNQRLEVSLRKRVEEDGVKKTLFSSSGNCEGKSASSGAE